jgi:hypothetical protein
LTDSIYIAKKPSLENELREATVFFRDKMRKKLMPTVLSSYHAAVVNAATAVAVALVVAVAASTVPLKLITHEAARPCAGCSTSHRLESQWWAFELRQTYEVLLTHERE